MARIAGKRNARRIAAVCPIRLWGMDAGGKPFIEAATTVNVSYTGVLLKDVPAKLSVGDTIALRSGEHKCRFRVVWLGREGTPDAGHLGLQSLDTENPIWDDLNLPAHSIDTRAIRNVIGSIDKWRPYHGIEQPPEYIRDWEEARRQ